MRFRTSRASEIGVFAGAEPIGQPQRGDAEQADHQRAHRDRRQSSGAAVARRRCTPGSARQCAASSLAGEREALVLAADARHRAVDEHQREVLRLLAAELVEAPEACADALERRRSARVGIVADASSGRRAGGSLLRRARRRCRLCWGSSRRWRRGCIRCARRSSGSRRSGSPR